MNEFLRRMHKAYSGKEEKQGIKLTRKTMDTPMTSEEFRDILDKKYERKNNNGQKPSK